MLRRGAIALRLACDLQCLCSYRTTDESGRLHPGMVRHESETSDTLHRDVECGPQSRLDLPKPASPAISSLTAEDPLDGKRFATPSHATARARGLCTRASA